LKLTEEQFTIIKDADKEYCLLEDEFWREYATVNIEREFVEDEESSLNSRLISSSSDLDKLRSSYLLNDAFHIWHFGHFVTINGRRLGTMQSQNVDFVEINAAWGYASLLLDTLRKKLNYEWQKYKIVPKGSFSKVEKMGKKSEILPLHGPNTFFNKYKDATTGFIYAVQELANHIKTFDMNFVLPYEIQEDRIHRQSLHSKSNSQAFKYLFTNVKSIIMWTAEHEDNM